MKFEIPVIERLHRKFNPPPPLVVPFDVGYTDPFWKPPKAEEQAAAAVESEADAEPPNINPPERDLSAEVSELCAPILDYLSQFTVTEQPDSFEKGYINPLDESRPAPPEQSADAAGFESRKVCLLADFRAWGNSLSAFLEDHRAFAVRELKRQHAEAWTSAREQQSVVAGIVAEHDQFTQERRTLTVALNKARSLFHSHETVKPDLAALPSQSDLDAWQSEHSRLESEYEEAQQVVNQQLERGRRLAWRYEEANTTLAALLKTESDLRSRLGGEDSREVGFLRPPEL
jgi:hypothetical protein